MSWRNCPKCQSSDTIIFGGRLQVYVKLVCNNCGVCFHHTFNKGVIMSKEAKRSRIRRAFDKILAYTPSHTEFLRNGSKSLVVYSGKTQATITPAYVVLVEGGPETLTFELLIEGISQEDVAYTTYKANALSLEFVVHKINETFAQVSV